MKKLRKKIKKERERELFINARALIYNKFNINDSNKQFQHTSIIIFYLATAKFYHNGTFQKPTG